jgi:pimeloyl-ACP methyl ester carboxylesterase
MTLACTRAGSGGTPIVFVHGFACDRSDWRAQMEHFAPARQVIACDLPGHGESPGGAADASIERCGEQVAALLGELGAPAVLVGHSLGCRVVLQAYRRSPARVAALGLMTAAAWALATPHRQKGNARSHRLRRLPRVRRCALFAYVPEAYAGSGRCHRTRQAIAAGDRR